ncbi:Cytoskeletal signaling protein slm1 [Cytospora mali]|uniref:Cytoskeletal signaling protein slm1 n=1 Tax=Cytospora mali TaxID=578113 RepID=A0A194UNB0_CYTMA|nr:Cytoskeletal signaling protein slm1 [Valsa mali var. pyri (nom. inval.)]
MAEPTTTMPVRSGTVMTKSSTFSETAIPDSDPSTTAGLLAERLQAWKHAVGYLEEYMGAIEKIHKEQSKEYEKALKTISKPLREGHHFDQNLGGIAGFYENLRQNTQALVNTNAETEKSIKGSVLPILDRLHKEIKNKAKELAHGAQKGAKEVEKVRNTTQKHIELLGQNAASFESTGGKMNPLEDPYVIQRGVLHRLNKQVIEENNHRNDLIAVQANFQDFEAHVLQVLQQAMEVFNQFAGGQAEKTRALYADMLGAVQRIPPDQEWQAFSQRNADILVDPTEPPRAIENITFPNQDHPSARPLIEGSLERKSRNKLSWGHQTGYYVVTPSKFLHEFKSEDNVSKDPIPELSIYLPEATIGTPSGDKFNVKGKDKSKTMSSKLTGTSELSFKAHTPADAERWFEVMSTAAAVSAATAHAAVESAPTSPAIGSGESPVMNEAHTPETEKVQEEGAAGTVATNDGYAQKQDHAGQTSGITGDEKVASPTAVSPSDTKGKEEPNTATTIPPSAATTTETKATAPAST